MKICKVCGKPISPNQNLYEVKLDNGEIVYSHGMPCIDRHNIKRPKPILSPDWWVRQIPNEEGLK